MVKKQINGPERCIFCCDWGTSSFRLWLVNYETGEILFSHKTNEGAKPVYEEWQSTKQPDRIAFYCRYLKKAIDSTACEIEATLNNVPVIISGMASSSIGLEALPYASLPFALNGSGIVYKKLTCTKVLSNVLYLVSGVQSDTDIMRGEEMQIIGLSDHFKKSCICILPGTHSKHIRIEGYAVNDFRTFMTGELFELLTHHSILRTSIKKSREPYEESLVHFEAGVRKAFNSNILNALFSVRTNEILYDIRADQNYYYLSGLLIGYELKSLINDSGSVFLCGGTVLLDLYERALVVLGYGDKIKIIQSEIVDRAVISGQLVVYNTCLVNW